MISTIVGNITITQAEEFAERIRSEVGLLEGIGLGDYTIIFYTEYGVIVNGLDDIPDRVLEQLGENQQFDLEIPLKRWAQVDMIREAIRDRLYWDWEYEEGL